MLPSTSASSPLQGNGALNSRDAARHTAGAKRYKYLRRLFRFRQMDFEFAGWQMLYLFTSPQRVYRNFHYRKQTKDQWARDDPAFLVLLSVWLCVSTVGFGFVLDMGFFKMIKLLLWVVFIDCVGVGLLISTLMCNSTFHPTVFHQSCHPNRHIYWIFGWKYLLVDCYWLLHLYNLPGIQCIAIFEKYSDSSLSICSPRSAVRAVTSTRMELHPRTMFFLQVQSEVKKSETVTS
uniref:Unc-50 inner nuclear membrane RNA binding protein n=1 Tax=Myotis myotis TaxID=51298 RepID=A0A7J7RDE6_MYOMY|nr:unc-50 inner nuclear membrane RNA binding protein [Myotis myotis]